MNKKISPWILILGLFGAVLVAVGTFRAESRAADHLLSTSAQDADSVSQTSEDETRLSGGDLGEIPVTGQRATASATSAPTKRPLPSSTRRVSPSPQVTPTPKPLPSSSSIEPPPTAVLPGLSAELWKEWPVMPGTISADLRSLYQRSVAQGLIDPHAFSVFGDCQAETEAFLGVFDTSPGLVARMADDLQETVAQFQGSFYRYNPAAKSASSAGSLLYAPWNDNKEGKCESGETPVDCELRVHRPSIVFIHTGTHFESKERNFSYLSIIIEKVLQAGAVPILVTKADNLEFDERVNQNLSVLAVKYQLPLWNFWASVHYLDDNGLKEDKMHLTEEATTVHQLGALQVLSWAWREVR